jgi:hypothetical protein
MAPLPRLTWAWTLLAILYACTVLASSSPPHRRSRQRSLPHQRHDISTVNKRAAPSGWSIYTKSGNDGGGCYNDSSAARILTGYTVEDSKNGLQSCLTTCASKGFAYAGVQYGIQCFVSLARVRALAKLTASAVAPSPPPSPLLPRANAIPHARRPLPTSVVGPGE